MKIAKRLRLLLYILLFSVCLFLYPAGLSDAFSNLKQPEDSYISAGVEEELLNNTTARVLIKLKEVSDNPFKLRTAMIEWTGVEHYLVQSAYDSAAEGDVILMRDLIQGEDLSVDRNISVTMRGGFNCDHSTQTGTTVIAGNMTISSGTLTIQSGTLEINCNIENCSGDE